MLTRGIRAGVGSLRIATVPLILGLAAAATIIAVLIPAARQRRRVAKGIVQTTARLLLRMLGIQVTHKGVVPSTSALLVGNHISWVDVVVAAAYWPCTFVAKIEVCGWPLIGRLADAIGVIYINRSRKRELLRTIVNIGQRLQHGEAVLMFPEATTSDGRAILPFRSALFAAAVRSGMPVLPFSVSASCRDADTTCLTWLGQDTLWSSVFRIVCARNVCYRFHFGAEIDAGINRKALAAAARKEVTRRFVPVHRAVPIQPASAPIAVRTHFVNTLLNSFRQ